MKVLVVVDMQNDFITGSLGTPEAQAIVPNVKKKIEESVKNGDLIIFTRDTHADDYLESREGKKLPVKHCVYGTAGWSITGEILPPGSYDKVYTMDKYTFGSFRLAQMIHIELLARDIPMEQVSEIELIGLCTDICVVSNALLIKAAYYDKVEVSVDATCCAGVTPETHEAALKTMEMCQINVKRG